MAIADNQFEGHKLWGVVGGRERATGDKEIMKSSWWNVNFMQPVSCSMHHEMDLNASLATLTETNAAIQHERKLMQVSNVVRIVTSCLSGPIRLFGSLRRKISYPTSHWNSHN